MNEDQLTPTDEATEKKEEQVSSEAVVESTETGVAPSQEPPVEQPVSSANTADAPSAVSSPPAAATGKTEDEMLFEAALASLGSEDTNQSSGGSSGLSKGERIEAKVIQVESDRVFVDLGTKAEGIVPLNELSHENIDTAVGHVKPGDTFEVIVLRTNSAEGNPVVSKRRADFDVQWQKILDSFNAGEVFDATVVERVKGGLVVDIGVRGFVPATHVGSGKLRNIEKYVGETLPVKIIEVDKERKKVVLSNRAADEERRGEIKDELFTKTKPGDVMEGTVRRLTDYGAFVDLGGIDGLLHISEMSWVRIDHPREVLKEGDDIKVMVLRLDEGGGRISLGLRQVLPDPWNLIKENYKVGQKIKCNVTRMVQSGCFVRLPEGAEAFLPLSEISEKRLKRPQDELEDNQEIEPMVIDLRPDERRMVLSLRDLAPGERRFSGAMPGAGMGGQDFGGMRGVRKRKPRQPDFDAAPAQRTPTGGATIGERLGLLKGLMRDNEGGKPAAPEAAPAEEPKE